MIAQVKDAKRYTRFANACRGLPVLDALLPLDCTLFRKSQPWRFYAGPTLALELSGSTAWLAGHANPAELASFLSFCGCEGAILDEAVFLKDGRVFAHRNAEELRETEGMSVDAYFREVFKC